MSISDRLLCALRARFWLYLWRQILNFMHAAPRLIFAKAVLYFSCQLSHIRPNLWYFLLRLRGSIPTNRSVHGFSVQTLWITSLALRECCYLTSHLRSVWRWFSILLRIRTKYLKRRVLRWWDWYNWSCRFHRCYCMGHYSTFCFMSQWPSRASIITIRCRSTPVVSPLRIAIAKDKSLHDSHVLNAATGKASVSTMLYARRRLLTTPCIGKNRQN